MAADGGDRFRAELARLVRQLLEEAHAVDGSVSEPIREHLGGDVSELAVHGEELPSYELANLQLGLDAALALRPGAVDLDLGVVGRHADGFELRAFVPKNGATDEDPVTGSLNASVAQWLIGTGRAPRAYVARQGTAIGRAGRVHVAQDDDGTIWVGGGTVTCVDGAVDL